MSAEPGIVDATVLVCSRERPRLLLETVRSVLAGDAVPGELLVVDQSAHPDTATAAERPPPGCTLRYVHSRSRGLSTARNFGLREAAHEVVVSLDDDMLVGSAWLRTLVAAVPTAGGAATGRVLAAEGEGGGTVAAAALLTRDMAAVFRGRQPGDVMPGSNVAVTRSVVIRLGGYDERLGPGARYPAAEDNDLGFRLLEAGYEIRHEPQAVTYHRGWRSRTGRVRQRWEYGRGKGAFYAKHLRASDRHIVRRLTGDLRRRVRRALSEGPRRPRTVVEEAISVCGILSGALEWGLREGLAGRGRR